MTDQICTRCLESKPGAEFIKRSTRCKSCRNEANALNVAHFRQAKTEREANLAFSNMMRKWRT